MLVRADRQNAERVYRALASFDEAIADGAGFELEGRKIPVIGRPALLKNKKAAGREQDDGWASRSRSRDCRG